MPSDSRRPVSLNATGCDLFFKFVDWFPGGATIFQPCIRWPMHLSRWIFTRISDENLNLKNSTLPRILNLIPESPKGLPDDIILGTNHTHETGNTVLFADGKDFPQ